MPARIALTLVALTAIVLGVWRFSTSDAVPAVDVAFVAMTVLVLVLGVREWVRVLQRTPRIFDNSARRFTRVYNGSQSDEQNDRYSR